MCGTATTERRTEGTAHSRDRPSNLGSDCSRTTRASRDPASLPGCAATRQTGTTYQHPQARLGTMHQRAPTASRTRSEWLAELAVDRLAADRRGLGHGTGRGEPLDQGKTAEPRCCALAEKHCHRALLPETTSDPPRSRRVAASLLKQPCASTGTRHAHGQFHASRTPQKCVRLTLPTPSVHCTEERVPGARATEDPFLLPYFATAWHETGTALWTRRPNGWPQTCDT